MYGEPESQGAARRPPSGWRYVFIALVTFFIAGLIFALGLLAGGGSFLVDRLTSLAGLGPHATATPAFISGDAIVQQIREVRRLETTTYTIERVIEAKQSDSIWPDWLTGDRLLLIADGTIVVGVDLEQLPASAVTVSADGKSVTVDLPPVQIFNRSAILDNARTRVYDRQQGLFAPANAGLETQARQEAEGQILAAACDEGMMLRATEDAAHAMEQVLALSGLQVTVRPGPAPACP